MAEISETWHKKSLGDIANVISGYAFKSSEFGESGIPVIKIKNVRVGYVDLNEVDYVDEKYLSIPERYHVRSGDVLISLTGSHISQPNSVVGRVARHAAGLPRCLLNQRAGKVLIKDHSSCDLGFLFYALSEKETVRAIAMKAHGAASQANVSPTQVESIEISFPSLPIQQRIADILSAYDELIENCQQRIKILESMARALYREWFVHFRFPGHENHPRVASSLGEIPQGWEVKKLGQIANTFRGRSYRSVDLADEGGLPFLNLKCLDRDGGFRRFGLKRYTGEYKDIHVAKKGDIVMAVTDMTQDRRIVARAALVPTLDNEFGIFSMDLVRIEPTSSVPKTFLYSFLRYSSFADEVKQHANGANVLHLSPDRITDFHFPFPTANLMRRFADFVTPVLEEIDTLENKIQNLRRTRDLLLPRLLSGQINVEAL